MALLQSAGQWVRWEELFPVCLSSLNRGLVKACPFQWWQDCRRDGQPEKFKKGWATVQFSSVAQSCLALCDPRNCSMPGLPIHHQLPESTQTHFHWVGDAIQSSTVNCTNLQELTVLSECFVSWLFKKSHYREIDIQDRFMDMERGEERVSCMERVTWKLTLPYVKWIANGYLLYGSWNWNRSYVSI